MDYNNGNGCDKGDVMHAVCYSWSMEKRAKDVVQSDTLWKLRCKKKGRSAWQLQLHVSKSLEITHDDDHTAATATIVSSAIKPTPLH